MREAEIEQEVAVGVDVQVDDGQRERGLAELDPPQHVGELELDVVDAEVVVDPAVEDLEREPREELGARAVQRDPQPEQGRVVDRRRPA